MVSSILTPSILSVLDKSCDIVLLTDSNEEEQQSEKEAEKKFDEKDLFLNNIGLIDSYMTQSQSHPHSEYVLRSSDFIVDILLPPPRTFHS